MTTSTAKEAGKVTTTLQRRPKFTSGELEKLKQEVDGRKKVLFGAFSPTLTKGRKTAEWRKVTDAINKVSTNNRDVNEVKRKWENLKSNVKSKLATDYRASTMRKTGGGSPEYQPPNSEDERMIGIIGVSSIRGITGGIDSSFNDMDGHMSEVETEHQTDEIQSIEVEVRDENFELLGSESFHIEFPEAVVPAMITLTPKPSAEKPKSMSEKLLAAQLKLTSTLEETNNIVKSAAAEQSTILQGIQAALEKLVEIHQRNHNI